MMQGWKRLVAVMAALTLVLSMCPVQWQQTAARAEAATGTITADGVYGPRTAEAVRIFQGIFNLPQTGIIDYATWYELSEIFVGVSRIAEPQ